MNTLLFLSLFLSQSVLAAQKDQVKKFIDLTASSEALTQSSFAGLKAGAQAPITLALLEKNKVELLKVIEREISVPLREAYIQYLIDHSTDEEISEATKSFKADPKKPLPLFVRADQALQPQISGLHKKLQEFIHKFLKYNPTSPQSMLTHQYCNAFANASCIQDALACLKIVEDASASCFTKAPESFAEIRKQPMEKGLIPLFNCAEPKIAEAVQNSANFKKTPTCVSIVQSASDPKRHASLLAIEKQTQAKYRIGEFFAAQNYSFSQHKKYTGDIVGLGLSPSKSLYSIGFQEKGVVDLQAGLTADKFAELASRYCKDCTAKDFSYKVLVVGNIDDDDTFDIWTADQDKNLVHVVDDARE